MFSSIKCERGDVSPSEAGSEHLPHLSFALTTMEAAFPRWHHYKMEEGHGTCIICE